MSAFRNFVGEWTLKEAILFFGGAAGVVHQTLVANLAQLYLLALFGAAMGLAPFLVQDRKRSGEREES